MVTLSIVVGTRNRLDILKRNLDALIGRITIGYQIIIVDAGSTDGTLDYLRQLPGIRLVCDEKPIGQAQSLNQVFKTLTTSYTCWLSDDNVVQPGALDLAVNVLEQYADIGMVTLKVKDMMGPLAYRPYIGGIWSGILNCNQGVIRTQLFRDIDYFDESFRDYGIDADLTTKVLLAGYKVVHTKMVAIHHYRDHQNLPGAIGIDQRQARLAAANQFYKLKYANLLLLSYGERIQQSWKDTMWSGVQIAHKLLGLQTVPERDLLDWFNIFHSRYINLFDIWLNGNKPFYLVQRMPESALRKSSLRKRSPSFTGNSPGKT